MKMDLNLLRVFDILMEVRNVGRAADRLGLTQSAVSHALGRLREQIGDPLFLRTRGGLRPTRRANEIAPSIRDGLALLSDAVSTADFESAATTRTFTISAGSYFCVTLLPIVIERARREAPLAQFRIVAPGDDLLTGFDDGRIDLALGGFGLCPSHLTKTILFTDELVWIGRAGSAADDIATRPRLALARSAVSSLAEGVAPRDGIEQRAGAVPNAPGFLAPHPVTTYDTLSAGALIATSDLVALWPRLMATRITVQADVDVLATADQEPVELSMLWQSRFASDLAHMWLRGLMRDAAETLSLPAEASPG